MLSRTSFLIIFSVLTLTIALQAASVHAQDFDRIVHPMLVVDATTLQTDETRITLWGVKMPATASAALQLRAAELVGSVIGGGAVNCKPSSRLTNQTLIARCNANSGADLGLELLSNGYAIVDRPAIANTPFSGPYLKAQQEAKVAGKGIWRDVIALERENDFPAWLKSLLPYMPALIPAALFAGPLAGLLITALLMYYGLSQIRRAQQEERFRNERKEAALAAREKSILVSALAGELLENKNKLLAFLRIYREMLKGLKDPNETPKYQRVGDIVQKHPAMSKRVFESSIGKFSLLDINLSGHLSKLYSALPDEREYVNLEPDMAIEKAIGIVQSVIGDAEAMLSALDQATHALDQAAKEGMDTEPA